MKTRMYLAVLLALAFAPGATERANTRRVLAMPLEQGPQRGAAPNSGRPQGPCDIYGAAGTPCVAAHSTTRALSAAYNGPLYQVRRVSDGRTLDIGLAPASAGSVTDHGGYVNAAAQDAFCVNTICVITRIYDQSGKGNHLLQGPPGPSFPGPAKGGFDTQPIADMAPITIGGHKAYGVFIMPGMGFRNNDATGIAIDDEPEGIYYVIDGTHFDSGCCFDYGNSSTNGRAVGTGTMETTYFGTATAWGRGAGPGPWIMADMEAGLFSGYDAKQNNGDPTIDSWRFVTAVVDGGGGNKWDLRGGNAQSGRLTTFYNGVRPGSPASNAYFPMHKQGAILLGIGGDNGNGSAGTFYEGVMTTGYPSEATTDAVHANIVAARYDVPRVQVSRVTSFAPRSAQEVTATFTNTTGAPATGVSLGVSVPAGWTASVSGSARPQATFAEVLAPGAAVRATFRVTAPASMAAGFLVARAQWTNSESRRSESETSSARIRSVLPIKINEIRLSTGVNPTNQFIELFNASGASVDLSNWTIVNTQSQWAPVTLARISPGTTLAGGAHYLLGLSNSGLAASADPGASVVYVRSTTGIQAGQSVDIDGETRVVRTVGSAAAPMTTVFIPVSTGPWLTVPAGATNVPVTNATGFVVGEKISIDIGGQHEVATVTAVGKAATQTTLVGDVAAGATTIRVVVSANVTVGDTLTIGTGARKETVKVKAIGAVAAAAGPAVGAAGGSTAGGQVELVAPLRFNHASGVDVSDVGTGISFSPATRFAHTSGDAVQALGSGVALDRPLARSHAYGAPVVNAVDTTTGYQGGPAPRQWFGGPLSVRAGSIALMDATGAVVVDAMVYGSQQSSSSGNGTITSPELATLEGDQGKGGCIAVVPVVGRGAGPGATAAGAVDKSVGRLVDGRDTDSNCTDFVTQPGTTLPMASALGATNIKVASVADLSVGQTITIDSGANLETAVIATVGTAGGTTVGAASDAGATFVAVVSAAGFVAGQTITLDNGTTRESAVVAGTTPGGRGGARITLTAPLTMAHPVGALVSGSGLTLNSPLARAHAVGAQVATAAPTPGAPNRFAAPVASR